ncbi:hypothetical protein V6N12_076210 [Hibiscus sabdariffa]|uniref:RNase H type-1 domain-containing protein n=1 Tax=Hibiscus sabdariffa TaxID=183260 RepID=A0ABR2B289_9ROSI
MVLELWAKYFLDIWKGILKSACCEDSFGLCFRANLSVQVGDGEHISFWDDVWLGNSSLKDQFPRFYALSCNKGGKVVDFGSWVKAKFGECSLSLNCIVNDPFVVTNLCLLPRPLASAQSWSPPPYGFAKLNVDGALSSSCEAGGLGGLLRDENGRTLFQFLESCGRGPPALIELQAEKLGVDLFLRSEWSTMHRLVVESDCKLVTDWLLRVSVPPFCFVRMVEGMVSTISNKGILVHWVPRCCNFAADSLAKAGIG